MEYPKLLNIQTIDDKFDLNVGVNGIQGKQKDTGRWRDLTAFWILGLCNDYGYTVMLTAAHDIINRHNESNYEEEQKNHDGVRTCNVMSTGAILLAVSLPSLIVKSLGSIVPFYINIRLFLTCFLQLCGFLLVAFADSQQMSLIGIALTSLSSGLGESSLLSYCSQFHNNVISTWSSGMGAAGLIASLSYSILIAMGVSPVNTILLMLCVPFIEGATFWILLRNPSSSLKKSLEFDFETCTNDQENVSTETAPTDVVDQMSLSEKISYIPSLMKYMLPLGLVYFFGYLINQALFELIDFRGIWLDQKSQYRWLQVGYEIGVFISRSSVNVMKINKIWLMAVFQLINVVLFLAEVITFFSPTIWLIFGIVLWEGFLGGAAYVNTFYRMSKEIPEEKRIFALGTVSLAVTLGIALAGFSAIPLHNTICSLALPTRSTSLLNIFK